MSPNTTATHSPQLDEQILLQMATEAGGIDELKNLVPLFLQETELLKTSLPQAVAKQDVAKMQIESHTLKSISATFGALYLSHLARDMEMYCRENNYAEAARLLEQILQNISKTQSLLIQKIQF
jgi:HPt (histidine-containing phosphotransfer) domain-containing protein